jgi:hypothetical protein
LNRVPSVERLQADLSQGFIQPLVDQLHAARVFLVRGLHLQRALEIVEHGKQSFDGVHGRILEQLAALPLDAAAVVLEFGLAELEQLLQLAFLLGLSFAIDPKISGRRRSFSALVGLRLRIFGCDALILVYWFHNYIEEGAWALATSG